MTTTVTAPKTAAGGTVPSPTSGSNAPATYLPAADIGGDPLSLIYASSLIQQTTSSSTDATREQEATKERDRQLKEQKKEHDDQLSGGRGIFGSITHLVGDILHDAVKLKPLGVIRDTVHDVDHDMINNPTFWNELKQGAEVVGMVVGAVGSMVATGGTSAPVLVAVALSTAAMVDSKAHILQKLGVSASAAGWADLGAGATGAVLTLGASIAPTATTTLTQSARNLNAAAQVVSGSSQVVSGGATVGTSVITKHNADLEADAERAGNNAKRLQGTVDWILDGMKDAQKSSQRVLSTVSQSMQTKQATSMALTMYGKV
jgi:hypothetical protein